MSETPSLTLLTKMGLGFGGLSLFSVGGALSILSDLHTLIVDHYHWMTDADFVQSFAISQFAPGPNMLLTSYFGWRIAGLAGLIVGTLAVILPTCALSLVAGRGMAHFARAPWFPAVKAGLAPVVVGLYTGSGLVAARAADLGTVAVIITVAVAASTTFSKHNPMWGLLVGALVGGVASFLGWQ